MRCLQFIRMRKSKYLFVALLILLIPVVGLSATTHDKYLDTSGSGSGTGAVGDPYADVDELNDFLNGSIGVGDTVNVVYSKGDTWSGSGEEIGYTDGDHIDFPDCTINVQATGSGDDPIIRTDDRQFLWISDSSDVNITISNITFHGANASYYYPVEIGLTSGDITIDDVVMDGSVQLDGDPQACLRFVQTTGALEIKNCNIHDIGDASNPSETGDTNGIELGDQDTGNFPSSLSIHNNTIYNVQGDCIATNGLNFTGGASKGLIYDNTLYNAGENSLDIKESTYIDVYDNLIYKNGFGSGGTSGSGPLVTIHGDNEGNIVRSDNIRIYKNYLNGNYDGTSNFTGIGIDDGNVDRVEIYLNRFEQCGPFIGADYGDLFIHNNLFIIDGALAGEGGTNYSVVKAGSSTDPIEFYNNTVYDDQSQLNYGFYMASNHTLTAYNNVIELTKADSYPMYVSSYSPTLDYNTYYNGNDTERIYYNSTAYKEGDNFSTYAGLEGHTNEKSRDPDLAADLSLNSTSNEIDTAKTLDQAYENAFNRATTWSPISVVTNKQGDLGAAWDRGCSPYDLAAYDVSPVDGATGVSITASATWNYVAYVDDVDVYLDKGTCAVVAKTTLVSDDDAGKTYDMSTLDYNSDYCLVLVANDGASQGPDQEFEFTTTAQLKSLTRLKFLKKGAAGGFLKLGTKVGD